jgi:hypothetical protein
MSQSEAERYRAALEEIVRVGTTPDTTVIGTLPGGELGPIWYVGGQDKAFEKILTIAKTALKE